MALRLPGGTSFFPEPQTDAACGATVRGWWRNGLLRVAYAFESAGVAVGQPGGRGVATVGAGGVLVTHAGLSCGAWRILGAPPDAAGVVARLDADKAELPLIVWREGSVITGAHDAAAGPLWASAAESVASWVEAGVVPPFSQVFGHSAIFRWEPGERPRWDPEIAKLLESGALTGAVDEGADTCACSSLLVTARAARGRRAGRSIPGTASMEPRAGRRSCCQGCEAELEHSQLHPRD